ncbi:hypothetical protein KCU77_g1770, partial [Aureobasidium melanogenum]
FFKFRAEVTDEHKQKFVTELKKLKSLPCVKEQRLVVGGASITDPIERSKGFEFALLSFHEERAALEEYQKSDEHHHVTSTYMFPYKEDLMRYDFEVDEADEHLLGFLPLAAAKMA